jgi:hypothetical protein
VKQESSTTGLPMGQSRTTNLRGGHELTVLPIKGRSIGGCESHPGKPPEEPGSQPPVSGESRAAKRGEAKLQAVTRVNSAASKLDPARDRGGRARRKWAKAAVRALDSGASWNPSGVEEMACSEGRAVKWGGPPAPVARSIAAEACPGHKATTESCGGAEGVGAGRSTQDRRDNTTRRRKGPALR